MRRIYFYAIECPWCPQITKAVRAYNRRNHMQPIHCVDVNGPEFGVFEDFLADMEEAIKHPFGTPMLIIGDIILTGEFDHRAVLALLEGLSENNGGEDENV